MKNRQATASSPTSKASKTAAARGPRLWNVDGLGQRARKRREQLHMSVLEVQEKTGLPRQNIYRIESGQAAGGRGTAASGLSVATLVRLAIAYDVSTDWLCGLTDDHTPKPRVATGTLSVAQAIETAQRRTGRKARPKAK